MHADKAKTPIPVSVFICVHLRSSVANNVFAIMAST
jgi:hypothetical protein